MARVETRAPLERFGSALNAALKLSLPQDSQPLFHMLRYHLGWEDQRGRLSSIGSGKAIRPLLCLFMCEAVGGHAERAMPAAVSLELIHNFSLIHDDLQDGDRERRHRPTVWTVWGKAPALMAGDVLCCVADLALGGLAGAGVPAGKAVAASRMLTELYLEMIEGQYLDLSFEGRTDISQDAYLDMISRKTGALMEAATRLGAFLGTEDAARVESLAKCGRLLGLAFQVRDDVLGVWGDEKVTGKAIGADLRRQKRSFPVVHALQVSRGKQKKRLEVLASQPQVEEAAVDEMLGILEDVRAHEFAQKLAEDQGTQALACARQARLSKAAQQELEALVEFVLIRQK